MVFNSIISSLGSSFSSVLASVGPSLAPPIAGPITLPDAPGRDVSQFQLDTTGSADLGESQVSEAQSITARSLPFLPAGLEISDPMVYVPLLFLMTTMVNRSQGFGADENSPFDMSHTSRAVNWGTYLTTFAGGSGIIYAAQTHVMTGDPVLDTVLGAALAIGTAMTASMAKRVSERFRFRADMRSQLLLEARERSNEMKYWETSEKADYFKWQYRDHIPGNLRISKDMLDQTTPAMQADMASWMVEGNPAILRKSGKWSRLGLGILTTVVAGPLAGAATMLSEEEGIYKSELAGELYNHIGQPELIDRHLDASSAGRRAKRPRRGLLRTLFGRSAPKEVEPRTPISKGALEIFFTHDGYDTATTEEDVLTQVISIGLAMEDAVHHGGETLERFLLDVESYVAEAKVNIHRWKACEHIVEKAIELQKAQPEGSENAILLNNFIHQTRDHLLPASKRKLSDQEAAGIEPPQRKKSRFSPLSLWKRRKEQKAAASEEATSEEPGVSEATSGSEEKQQAAESVDESASSKPSARERLQRSRGALASRWSRTREAIQNRREKNQ